MPVGHFARTFNLTETTQGSRPAEQSKLMLWLVGARVIENSPEPVGTRPWVFSRYHLNVGRLGPVDFYTLNLIGFC